MKRVIVPLIVFIGSIVSSNAQIQKWEGKDFEISKVKASLVQLNGENVLKVERDLEVLPLLT